MLTPTGNRLLISAFQFSKFDPESFELDRTQWKQKTGLLQRQKEIKDVLSKIGDEDSRLTSEVDSFFSHVTALFESLSDHDDESLNIDWLLNKAQIERIFSIVEIVDEHKSKVDDLFRPINDFLSTINSFYSESEKELRVNTVGQIYVSLPNGGNCEIEGLSSGERQLLVIFAHAFFSRHNVKKPTFIIDEPELSLHLKWQEKFAETIFAITKDAQFILATHSPEIVGVNKNKSVECR